MLKENNNENRKLEVKNYPTLSEINEQYKILGNWKKWLNTII